MKTVNGFQLLTIFVKNSMFAGVLDALLDGDYMLQRAPFQTYVETQISPNYHCNDSHCKHGYTPHKTLVSGTNTMIFLSKIRKHKVTWSESFILVSAVVLDLQPLKFARGKGLKKTYPANSSKSLRMTEEKCLRVKLCMSKRP